MAVLGIALFSIMDGLMKRASLASGVYTALLVRCLMGTVVLASASLMLLSWAYARAEAQVLVPIEYTAFVWSALVGWLWFSEPVTRATLAGLTLILVGVWLGTRRHPEPIIPPG